MGLLELLAVFCHQVLDAGSSELRSNEALRLDLGEWTRGAEQLT